jgi:hypothetical protein
VRRILAAIASDPVIVLALLAFGCATPSVKPPFQWDSAFASPGKTLTIRETSRLATSHGTQVFYRIEAAGFTRADKPSLWWCRGTEYEQVPITLTDAGAVQVSPGADDFAIAGFVSGQPIDMALVAAGSGERAQAKVVPFPIEAQGTGGCSVSAELEAATGLLFLITLRGFPAGATVHVEDHFGTEVLAADHVASPQGEIRFPVLFGPSDHGEATLSAKSGGCSVTLTYRVGKDAIDVR